MRDLKHLVITAVGAITILCSSLFSPENQGILHSNEIIFGTYSKNLQQDFNTGSNFSDITNNTLIHNNNASDLSIKSNYDTNFILTSSPIEVDSVQQNENSIVSYVVKSSNTLPLIYESSSVDYKSYIPKLRYSKEIRAALDINNPDIAVSASSAILFNAGTGEVLYYKKPVTAVFPASTAKLLSSLVALEWCKKGEKVTVGDEIEMIASDSSTANLKKGEVLTVSTLLEAMLLPSGNDAAYVMAAHVGKKSLKNPKAKNIDAIKEFVKLMNAKAKELGVRNSNFVTPDGYDAIGQYTTAYDMGLIALASIKNTTIQAVTKKNSSTRTLISGQKHTWRNTNSLINKNSKWYYSNAIGLKTGTTSIAGKCLISAAKQGDDLVVCVVMNSSTEGRWADSTKLLKYGLNKIK